MSQPVLDIIAEYPEVEHVAPDMQQPAVHEHRGKYGEHRRYRLVRVEAQDVLGYRAVRMHQILAVSG